MDYEHYILHGEAKSTEFSDDRSYLLVQILPKALRTQVLTALTSNFGLEGLVWQVWFGRFGLVGLVW